ncbi:MAG TPA: hypothetical protein VIN58_11225 [Roseateles sp.]
MPDKQVFFEELNVDITDMPTDFQEIRKIFLDGRESKVYANPPRSAKVPREYEVIRQWRADAGSVTKPWVAFGKVGKAGSVVSAGGGHAALEDSTESNQPVFASFTHQRPGDLIAVSVDVAVSRDGKPQWRTLRFKPPKQLHAGGYTPWALPASEEGPGERSAGRSTWWRLTQGQDLPVYPVGADAPRVRYRLLSADEYWQFANDGQRAMSTVRLQRLADKNDGQRAMSTVRLQRLADKIPDEGDRFRLLPAKRAVIPSC